MGQVGVGRGVGRVGWVWRPGRRVKGGWLLPSARAAANAHAPSLVPLTTPHYVSHRQARANRGILYVDEVNLLDDSLVDVVLDASAGGINTVEREGISIQHPAKFIMIGSGNPQEGEMRPQLLDRFGLSVQVRAGVAHARICVEESKRGVYLFHACGFWPGGTRQSLAVERLADWLR